MPKILSCVNLKGGVGKTAIAVNFAAYCGRKGLKTLLIDCDPQTNATFSCISIDVWKTHSQTNGTVANLFGLRSHTHAEDVALDASKVLKPDVFKNVDLIPSHLDLFTIDLDLAGETARETKLRRAIHPIADKYQVVVCDCPPNLTIPTQNALAMSSHFVVPVSPDFLSSIGIALLLTRVKKLCVDLEHELEHSGIVISRVGRPSRHREVTAATLRAQFGTAVFDAEIRERSAVSESAEKNLPIFDHGDREASAEFAAVSDELLKRMGLTT